MNPVRSRECESSSINKILMSNITNNNQVSRSSVAFALYF